MCSHGRRLVQFISWSMAIMLSLTATAAASTVLSSDEVDALKDIAVALGKNDWNFSVDPCSGQSGWITTVSTGFGANNVTCGNCSVDATTNNTVCHVTDILLKAQSLSGILPPDFARLPYLKQLDLTWNYLNGTIPPEWGSLPLVDLSLIGNRLTGPIPKEFGNISTLESLVVECNQLSGPIPSELGNLSRISRLDLSSNFFTGELPPSLSNLTTLTDIRLADNQFNGTIPDFIKNWKNLTKLVIQASGFRGPIPSSIEALAKLQDLRISDLDGPEAPFPQLNRTSRIQFLILRSCNITGSLPGYLAAMTSLKTLDVSFNKLTGEIPTNYSSLYVVDYVYFTGNMLNGSVSDWITAKAENVDLSYNNFATKISSCQQRSVNLFASSSKANNLGTFSCLTSSCSKSYYNLYINCGGKSMTIGSRTYEEDTDPAGPSTSFQSSTNWASSTTGYFMDDDIPTDSYTVGNNSILSINGNPQLYTSARLSPISLSYYGYCFINGSYTVSLHFAEIMFTAGAIYQSLGRRIFDVYIQGERVLKDFDIVGEAGGIGKAIVRNFTTNVTDGTLEIRFYWAGKGTTLLPTLGVYGPLISAISVNPDFDPPKEIGADGNKKLSVGAVVGIVISVAFVILLIVGILWWRRCLGRKDTTNEDLKGLDLQTGSFTLRQIKAATNNFDAENKIGEGGFGCVYKGRLLDGTVIAVKQLSDKSKQGNREFLNEIGMISALQHPHLVKLYGCCTEGNQLLLVYEYLENNNLARALFGRKEVQLNLDWKTRHKICVGIARGLAYLHEESRLKIVHRDIKATNVLLDKNLNAKISDFGLAKLDEEDNTHISTRVAGTFGYMAPEYAMRGYLTDKADVYSFGIVALEIISGQSNTSYREKEEALYILDWAHLLKEKGDLMDLVDPRLGSDINKDQVLMMIHVGLLCTHVSPPVRPAMSTVVSMLEGRADLPESIPEKVVTDEEKMMLIMRKHFRGDEEETNITTTSNMEFQTQSISQSQSIYLDEPWTSSSTSTNDLYPMLKESGSWRIQDKSETDC